MIGRLPEFLGVGVQKGGTTTLQRLLEQHPGAFLPAAKELHYFSLHFDRGEAWYREQFAAASPGQRCGEITPYYLFHPLAPARIQALLPQARLIVLLRDPVERALSQYFHSRRLGVEPLELEPALAAAIGCHRSHQEHSYLARSCYEQQLPLFEALFPVEQLLVLRSEDLFAQPERVWGQVLAFLKLDPWPLPLLAQPANAGRGEAAAVPEAVRRSLREQLQPTYDWVANRCGITWPHP
jgi:hypothetical protein